MIQYEAEKRGRFDIVSLGLQALSFFYSRGGVKKETGLLLYPRS